MDAIDTNPELDRQRLHDGNVLLWRDRDGGGREGLLLVVEDRSTPSGAARSLDLYAYRLDETVARVEIEWDAVWAVDLQDAAEELYEAFGAPVNVDSGCFEEDLWAPDPGARAWVERELEGGLLAVLRERFERTRLRVEPPPPWPAPAREAPRVGPDAPCPCGSGRGRGRCCG